MVSEAVRTLAQQAEKAVFQIATFIEGIQVRMQEVVDGITHEAQELSGARPT